MTLSTWFREYVYIPLGGNRKGKTRTFINLLIVWALTGLWHGASWNFILWGLYFAFWLILEKAFLGKQLLKLPKFISHIYTMILVLFGFFIFIYCDLENPVQYFYAMFSTSLVSKTALYDLVRSLLFLVVLIIGSTQLPHKIYCKLKDKTVFKVIMCIALPAVLLLCTAYLVDSSYNPFLYFRF